MAEDRADRPASNVLVVPLDVYESSVERGEFLEAIASAALFILIALLSVMIVAVAADILKDSGGRINDREYQFALAAAAFLAVSFAVYNLGVSIAQMRRTGLVIVTFLFGGVLTLYGLWRVQRVLDIRACGSFSDLFNQPVWCETDIPWLRFLLALPLLIPVSFGLRVAADAMRLARTPQAVFDLAMTATRRRGTMSVSRALGVHPICRFLPGRWRRFCVSGLFVLASLALTVTIVLVMFVAYVSPETVSSFGFACAGLIRSGQDCLTRVEPGVLLFSGIIGAAVATFSCLRFLGRRLARVSLAQLSEIDNRPPVLFLRSFLDDQVELPSPSRSLWHRLVAIGNPTSTLDHLLLEETTRLGPVVAIGIPGSPPPFGAARVYTSDDEWQAAITKLANDAATIAVVVDDTGGVLWELTHIRSAGHTEKTLFLLPPRLTAPVEAARVIKREFDESRVANGAVAGVSDPTFSGGACIGWHRGPDGVFSMFVTRRPTRLSYLCALRLAFAVADAR
jgi:hypothetical protein